MDDVSQKQTNIPTAKLPITNLSTIFHPSSLIDRSPVIYPQSSSVLHLPSFIFT